MSNQRFVFSNKELEVYFDRICLPEHKRVYDVTGLSNDNKLEFLHVLQKHQLVKIPWENLTQHYSWHKVIDVKPQHLFRKIVRQPCRGGYCMEVNLFFHHILLSLNFDVYMCGARIFNPTTETYGGFTHIINLVTIAGTKYLLDGGFGAQGPSRPTPLHHREVLTQIYPAQMRLIHEPLPQGLASSQKVWQYQYRYTSTTTDPSPLPTSPSGTHSPSPPRSSPPRSPSPTTWQTMYSFPDTEFLPSDIPGLNLDPWRNPHNFFTHKVVCVRFTTARERNGPKGPGSPYERDLEGDIDGTITLNHNVLKWRRNGRKVCEVPFRREEDRVEALGMYFGIPLAEEDLDGITGTAAAIGARAMLHA